MARSFSVSGYTDIGNPLVPKVTMIEFILILHFILTKYKQIYYTTTTYTEPLSIKSSKKEDAIFLTGLSWRRLVKDNIFEGRNEQLVALVFKRLLRINKAQHFNIPSLGFLLRIVGAS